MNNKIKLINPVNSYLNEDILKELYEYNMDNNLNVFLEKNIIIFA